jgi:hypothetical protein
VVVEHLHNCRRPPISPVQAKRDHWLAERVEEEHNYLDISKWYLRQLDIARRNGLVAIVDAALVDCGRSFLVRLWWSDSTIRVRLEWREW